MSALHKATMLEQLDNAQNLIAGVGDNNPPSELESLTMALQHNHEAALKHAQQLVEAGDRLPTKIEDDETAQKASDYIKQVMARKKTLEASRVNEKEPFLTMGRSVDGFFKAVTDKLDAVQKKAKQPLDAYLIAKEQAERARRAAEAEEARQREQAQINAAKALEEAGRAEEAKAMTQVAAASEHLVAALDKAAEVRPSELARTRSAEGSLATLRTRWVGEIMDIDALDLNTLRHHLNPDALQKAVNSFVAAGGRTLAGVTIKEISETVVR